MGISVIGNQTAARAGLQPAGGLFLEQECESFDPLSLRVYSQTSAEVPTRGLRGESTEEIADHGRAIASTKASARRSQPDRILHASGSERLY